MTTTSNRRLHFAGIYDRDPSWRSVFAEKAPEIAIASAEEAAADPASIRYCLAWRPKPGELAALPNLQVIFGLGAGVDGILADATIPAHLPIVRMVEQGLTQGMVEYVLWQVLYHHRRVWELEEAQAKGIWLDHSYPAPWDRTVGIMGLGEIGAAAAERLADFKFKLRGWSRNRKSLPDVESYAGAEELPAFLKGCDILVCLLPLTAETRGLLNADLFAHLPRGAALINAGRGAQLNEADFLAALQDGRIGSATLDVFQTEPLPPDHPFWQQKRLFITPHNASMTEAGAAVLAIRQQILDFEAGRPLRHVVDRQAGY